MPITPALRHCLSIPVLCLFEVPDLVSTLGVRQSLLERQTFLPFLLSALNHMPFAIQLFKIYKLIAMRVFKWAVVEVLPPKGATDSPLCRFY